MNLLEFKTAQKKVNPILNSKYTDEQVLSRIQSILALGKDDAEKVMLIRVLMTL